MLAISPNGDDFCGSGPLRGDDADAPGEAHDIGMHLRRLLGRPWLCTGSNSKDLLSVAHAIVLLLSVVARRSRAYRASRVRLTPSRAGRGLRGGRAGHGADDCGRPRYGREEGRWTTARVSRDTTPPRRSRKRGVARRDVNPRTRSSRSSLGSHERDAGTES